MEKPEEVNKPVEEKRKSIKVWSDNLQRYYYKSKTQIITTNIFAKLNTR